MVSISKPMNAGSLEGYFEKDEYYFIEMNPRFEGSLDIAIQAGVNMPKLLIDIIEGRNIRNYISYDYGKRYRYIFRNDFKCLLSGNNTLYNCIFETVNPRIKGEIDINDIRMIRAIWKKPIQDIIQFINNKF